MAGRDRWLLKLHGCITRPEDIVLTRSSKNKLAALKFLRFMISPWAQTQMARAGQMPVRKDVGKSLLLINKGYAVFAKQLETAKPRTPHPNWPKIDQVLGAAVLSAIKGETSTQAALDGAARQIDALLRG